MSWLDHKRDYKFSVYQTDWKGNILDVLNGFESGSSVHEYYVDMRATAQLKARNCNYIENAMLRVDVSNSLGESAQLGTFCVKPPSSTYQTDLRLTTFDLASPIYKLQFKLVDRRITLTGTKSFGDILDIFTPESCYTPVVVSSSVKNLKHTFSSEGAVYEPGTSYYQIMADICQMYNIRMDIQGHCILYEQYVSPSTKSPTFEFSMTNGTIEGQISVSDKKYDTVNDVIAVYNKDDVEIIGRATSSGSSVMSPDTRQMYKGERIEITDMSPVSQARANQLAKEHLDSVSDPNDEFTFNGLYIGKQPGSVGNLLLTDDKNISTVKKTLIKTMNITWTPSMRTNYTLKKIGIV